MQTALSDEDASITEIVELINTEPVLTARLLQTSNSAAFNRGAGEINSLEIAVCRLGFNLIRSIVIAYAIRQAEKQKWLAPVRDDLKVIWKNSNEVAVICCVTAKKAFKTKADQAMLTGLVHQIGRLYILLHTQKYHPELRSAADYDDAVERWQPILTRKILEAWNFPEAISSAVDAQNTLVNLSNTDNLDMLPLLLSAAKLRNRLANDPLFRTEHPEADDILQSVVVANHSFIELIAACQQDIADIQATLQ